MFQMLKNFFVDPNTGSMKWGSVIAAAGGALLGNMLLGPMLGGMLGGMGAIIAPIAGAALLVAGKEILLPMITGGGRTQQDAAHGFQTGHQHSGPAQGHDQQIQVPNVPNQPGQQPQR